MSSVDSGVARFVFDLVAGVWQAMGKLAPLLGFALLVKLGFWIHSRIPFGPKRRGR